LFALRMSSQFEAVEDSRVESPPVFASSAYDPPFSVERNVETSLAAAHGVDSGDSASKVVQQELDEQLCVNDGSRSDAELRGGDSSVFPAVETGAFLDIDGARYAELCPSCPAADGGELAMQLSPPSNPDAQDKAPRSRCASEVIGTPRVFQGRALDTLVDESDTRALLRPTEDTAFVTGPKYGGDTHKDNGEPVAVDSCSSGRSNPRLRQAIGGARSAPCDSSTETKLLECVSTIEIIDRILREVVGKDGCCGCCTSGRCCYADAGRVVHELSKVKDLVEAVQHDLRVSAEAKVHPPWISRHFLHQGASISGSHDLTQRSRTPPASHVVGYRMQTSGMSRVAANSPQLSWRSAGAQVVNGARVVAPGARSPSPMGRSVIQAVAAPRAPPPIRVPTSGYGGVASTAPGGHTRLEAVARGMLSPHVGQVSGFPSRPNATIRPASPDSRLHQTVQVRHDPANLQWRQLPLRQMRDTMDVQSPIFSPVPSVRADVVMSHARSRAVSPGSLRAAVTQTRGDVCFNPPDVTRQFEFKPPEYDRRSSGVQVLHTSGLADRVADRII